MLGSCQVIAVADSCHDELRYDWSHQSLPYSSGSIADPHTILVVGAHSRKR